MSLLRRLSWAVLLALAVLVLVLALVLLAPFTSLGTRILLAAAAQSELLEVEGVEGRLGGALSLQALTLTLPGLRVELAEVELRWAPSCLLERRVCIQRLHAGSLQLSMTADVDVDAPAGEAEYASGDTEPFVLPVAIELDSLRVGRTALTVPGLNVAWNQFAASVRTSRTHVAIDRVIVDGLAVSVPASDSPPSEDWALADLPSVELPLSIELNSLVLNEPVLSMDGLEERLQRVEASLLAADSRVRLSRLLVVHPQWGDAELEAEAWLQHPYRVDAKLRASLQEIPVEGLVVPLLIEASARGNLAALSLELAVLGAIPLQAEALLDLTLETLPFTAALRSEAPDLSPWLDPQVRLAMLELSASGDTQMQRVDGSATVSVTDLTELQLVLAAQHLDGLLQLDQLQLTDGRGSSLQIAGSLDYTDTLQLQLSLDSPGIEVPAALAGQEIRLEGRLAVDANLSEAWSIAVTDSDLSGAVAGQDFRLFGDVRLDHQWTPGDSQLTLQVLGVSLVLQGGSEIAADAPAGVSLWGVLDVPSLSALHPDLAGRGRLQLAQRGTAEDARFALDGQFDALGWPDGSIPTLRIMGRAALAEQLAAELEISAPRVQQGDVLQLEDVALSATLQGDAQTVRFATKGDIGLDLEVSGQRLGDDWQGRLAATTLATEIGRWKLERDVALEWRAAQQQLRVAAHCWEGIGTQLCLEDGAELGAAGYAAIGLSSNFAEVLDYLPTGVEIDSSIALQLEARWQSVEEAAVTAQLRMPAGRVLVSGDRREPFAFGWGEFALDASWLDNRLQAALWLLDEQQKKILDGRADIAWGEAPQLDAALMLAELDLSPLAPLVPSLARLNGAVSADVQASGALSQPSLTGQLALSRAALQPLDNPTAVEEFGLQVNFLGDQAQLEGNFLLGGGPAEISGELTWMEPALSLAIIGQNHKLLYPPDSSAIVSQDLRLQVSAEGARLEGNATVHSGLLELKKLPEGSVALSSDVILVDDENEPLVEANPFNVALNLDVTVNDQFRIDAMGFEGRLGGTMNVRQDVDQPLQLFGTVDIRDGRYRAFGQRLIMRRGLISFTGPPANPQLDVRAERDMRNSTVVAGISISGNARAPVVDFYSQPYMERPELLSFLLRGRGLDRGSNTGVDTSLLMATLGTGLAGSSGVLGQIERASPLRNLEISTEGAEDETQATIGGYVGDRLYVRYGMGLVEPINELMVRLYLMNNLWVEAISSLQRSVDLFYAFDIDW